MKIFGNLIISIMFLFSVCKGQMAGVKVNDMDAVLLAKDTNSSYSYGVAFPVSSHTWVTAAHVIDGSQGSVRLGKSKSFSGIRSARVLWKNLNKDIALLYCPKAVKKWHEIEAAQEREKELIPVKYPSQNIDYMYHIYTISQPGNVADGQSGSPHIREGKATGVIVASSQGKTYSSPFDGEDIEAIRKAG